MTEACEATLSSAQQPQTSNPDFQSSCPPVVSMQQRSDILSVLRTVTLLLRCLLKIVYQLEGNESHVVEALPDTAILPISPQ